MTKSITTDIKFVKVYDRILIFTDNSVLQYIQSIGITIHSQPLETIDTGLLLAITSDVQLDCGVNFGITRRATDFNPFVGLSVRF